MKNILNTVKSIFTSSEAKEFVSEVKETAGEVADKATEMVHDGVEKTKDAAHAVKEKVEKKVEAVTDGPISYDEFKKIEVKVGTINSVEKIEKSDKLLLLKVDVGEDQDRQIVSGIAGYFDDPQSLISRQAMFVTNLEPRTIFGHESNGMIFAVNDEEHFSILEPDTTITPGTQAS